MLPILFVFCVLAAQVATAAGSSCAYTRDLAVHCGRLVTDLNHDDLVTVAEMEAAKASALAWYERQFANLVGPSSQQVLDMCDADKDGRISEADYANSEATCLTDCATIANTVDYICKRLMHPEAFKAMQAFYKNK